MHTRYTTGALPPYRHRPGTTPHPVRDRTGHSYGRKSEALSVDEASWRENTTYLLAIDLFNEGYYWEAHEELEAYWVGAGRNTRIGLFLQGIIQAAAALLKLEVGKPAAAASLAAAATAKLRANAEPVLGLDGPRLADALEARVTDGSSDAVIITLDY